MIVINLQMAFIRKQEILLQGLVRFEDLNKKLEHLNCNLESESNRNDIVQKSC